MSNVTSWSPETKRAHLVETFNLVAKQFPDLLEPYQILLGDAETEVDRIEIMRRGLRETIAKRYQLHRSEPASPSLAALIKAGTA
jgi:hypothetical protein